MEHKKLLNFENFLFEKNTEIFEAETDPAIFKGLGNDPYQYMIKGDKAYYAEKTKGDLTSDSPEWIEQKYQQGIKEIKNLYSKISSKIEGLDPEMKMLIMEIQTALNKVKKNIPKLWTLPLTVDGIIGWKTAWTYDVVVNRYPYMYDVNDPTEYSVENYNGFKNDFKEIYGNAFEYFTKSVMVSGEGSEIEKLEKIVKKAKEAADTISGTLKSGIEYNHLILRSSNTSIPENLDVEFLIISTDCPIKNIPSSLKCKYLDVYNDGEPINIPLISKVEDLSIHGKAKLSDEWERIESLLIYDENESGALAYENPIPQNLKQFGRLVINSSAITKLPDNITVGKVKPNIIPSSELVKSLEKDLSISQDTKKLTKVKKSFFRRLFKKGDEKYEYKYESMDNRIYEEDIADALTETNPVLDLAKCYELKTLPVGLSVNGDLIITLSGLEQFTDEEIREVCTISGRIIRNLL